MSESILISLDNVTKRYQSNTVLEKVSLDIRGGECIVLLGHNGAGKTTLIKLILGLISPSEGGVCVLGFDPSKERANILKKGFGYLPERISFYESMTGMEVLRFYAKLKSTPLDTCDDLLERVGLTEAKNRPIQTYSKGMKQRLGLAQALLGDPQFLILDEPTSGLDPVLRRQVYELVNSKCAEGKTVIISSHSLKEVEAQADRVVIMDQGRVVANGSLPQLYEQAQLQVNIVVTLDVQYTEQVIKQLSGLLATVTTSKGGLSIDCSVTNKMIVLQKVMNLGDIVDDIQIKLPKLDDIYLHYIGRATHQVETLNGEQL